MTKSCANYIISSRKLLFYFRTFISTAKSITVKSRTRKFTGNVFLEESRARDKLSSLIITQRTMCSVYKYSGEITRSFPK